MTKAISIFTLILFLFFTAKSQDHTMHMSVDKLSPSEKDHETHLTTTGPIGVMGDHMHHKGTWMISYRYKRMGMNGAMSQSREIGRSEIFSSFMIAPEQMKMGMHMIGSMYALSDNITLMAMGSYSEKSMDLKSRSDMSFETRSQGFGDASISALVNVISSNKVLLHTIVGSTIPLGKINNRDKTPMSENTLLAYPMQNGSGSWGPFIGLNYSTQSESMLWGGQARYLTRLSENPEDYTLGDVFTITTWAALKASKNFNFSIRMSYKSEGQIKGANPEMNIMMMPLFNATNSGKDQVDANLGVNWFITEGQFRGVRVGAEVGRPLYQDLNGIQMKQDLHWTIGMQYVLSGDH